ncbi:MAG: hypothetical protein KDE50_25650 [Caldilineaceae bacterium]|nr:hypothetical protein [Caldilineaceae bacterium]
MNPMNPMFYILAILIVIAASVLFIIWFLQIKRYMVPQEERLVIYRWGHFRRFAGPGPVWVIQNFDYEQVMRTIHVREQDRNFVVPGLFSFDIPFGYTLNLWYRYDPVAAAQGDDVLLLELAQHSDDRYTQIGVKLREALVHAIMTVQKETKELWEQKQGEKPSESTVTLQPDSTSTQDVEREMSIIDKLMMVVPGMPSCERILDLVEVELAHVLPSIGVILNRQHRITVTRLDIAEDLIGSFSRDRIAKLLRGTYQTFSDTELARGVAMIEGLVEGLSIDGQHAADMQAEWRKGSEGLQPRLKHKLQADKHPTLDAGIAHDAISEAEGDAQISGDAIKTPERQAPQAEPIHADWRLSQSDLAVLKSVPSMLPQTKKQRKAS